ncbi:hypothetical protein AB6A40_007039 [Gnathostoma spinigerum]|uniref:Uncharacterized protein n=1 Tax=Gnathostoma spinigerum TaxID=75299 RepID=A0ABD6EK26_9BILA
MLYFLSIWQHSVANCHSCMVPRLFINASSTLWISPKEGRPISSLSCCRSSPQRYMFARNRWYTALFVYDSTCGAEINLSPPPVQVSRTLMTTDQVRNIARIVLGQLAISLILLSFFVSCDVAHV